ncbi:MAG: cellulase family glycosylhydrolase, partial [Polyangiaceae bacterium]
AIAWGKARGIHVCVALSFAPGYGVNAPKSPPDAGALDLWGDGATGDEARRQFAAQWRMLAERYRGTDSAHLSFNLVNEPPRISGARYLRTARAAVDAIRAVDAGRLVIADGASWGREPVPELGSLGVAQSTRGYAPFQLSHYAADWMERSTEWPEPVWPIPPSLNAHVYGPWKREWHRPLVLRGNFEPGPLAITVQHVSARAVLVLSADGVEVLRHAFVPGPGVGAWRHSEYVAEYGIHAATYGTRHVATLTKPAREIRVEVVDGDWLSFSELRIGTRTFAAHDLTWGVPQGDYTVDPSGAPTGMSERGRTEAATLFARHVEPWARFARDARVGVHVGEWGVYRETPHDVALSWMRDCLDNWRRVGFGWALWNLRGPFGVCDSERKDVSYEPYAGHRLDRRMLEVLVADTPS